MSRSDLLPIEQQVQSNILTYFPESGSLFFIIAVSGGVDSMALLYLLHQLGMDGLVVHINYGKRGTDSEKDAELTEEMAFQWGFDCQTVEPDLSDAEGKNFQQWARNFRYEVFRMLAKEHKADGIALAHHRDDQIETILQKQFRGAGLESWSAMKIWDGELFRPLLDVSRNEIEQYCRKKSIPYRTDKSNLKSDFARNYLRNEWLEGLEKHFPGWQQNVLRISEQASLFKKSMKWIENTITDNKDRFDRSQLLEMDQALVKTLVLHKLKKLIPDVEVSRDTLKQLENLGDLQTGRELQMTDSLSIMRDREWFKIVAEEPEGVTIQRFDPEEIEEHPVRYNNLIFQMEDYRDPDFETQLYLDVSKLSAPFTLRYWKHGDRFQPLGMEGHQNVSDHLANHKVSAVEKHKALVIESFEETICAVIFPPIENRIPPGTISERVKCDDFTQKCLTIKQS